jgi:hypothetical protein
MNAHRYEQSFHGLRPGQLREHHPPIQAHDDNSTSANDGTWQRPLLRAGSSIRTSQLMALIGIVRPTTPEFWGLITAGS